MDNRSREISSASLFQDAFRSEMFSNGSPFSAITAPSRHYLVIIGPKGNPAITAQAVQSVAPYIRLSLDS